MLSCWQYIPENRINFFDLRSRLNEIIMDNNKERPSVWFSNEGSSTTVNYRKSLFDFIFIVYISIL